jgi:serine/threonine-protein kinase
MPAESNPFGVSGLDTSTGPWFVQARMALWAKTVSLLAMAFYVVLNGLIIAGGAPAVPQLLQRHNIFHIVSVAWLAALWVITAGAQRSLRTLATLDAVFLLGCGVGLALMAAEPRSWQLLPATFAISVTMLGRAILVPSTAKRTALLSWGAAAPVLLVAIGVVDPDAPAMMRAINALSTFLWVLISTTLSTVASATIYGLRKQVKEAMDVGQYTLEEKLGSGGMGEVWRARHRMLIRPAAVKLIRPRQAGLEPEVLLRRFEREARATSLLRSPHTVQLYDFGLSDDGTLYYVMELLDGLDFDTLVERFGPVPPERAVHLLLQVCSSLADAHANGLVHRDIKPATLVVSRVGRAWDFVKVLDFGLVKLAGASAEGDAAGVKLTADGSASGTPAFMAPEIALGEPGDDHRVDIYSLGCVAYWLLTGKLVFDESTAMKVMFAHAHTPPPPPSSRVEVPIPPALEALVLACLEKDPAKRPQTAVELEARLAELGLASAWTRERAEKWWRTHVPEASAKRAVADVLLSQEARPLVIRKAR